MKQFLEFLPILIFVVVYYVTDIYYATAALMAAVTLQMLVYKFRGGKIPTQLTLTFWIVWIFGGLTLFFQDKTFIQWKPTIVNWSMSAALIGSHFFAGKNFVQRMLGSQLHLPDPVWVRLNFGWATGFMAAGVANLYVAYNYSEAFWVSYKLIGGFAITLSYIGIMLAYLIMGGHLKEAEAPAEVTTKRPEAEKP